MKVWVYLALIAVALPAGCKAPMGDDEIESNLLQQRVTEDDISYDFKHGVWTRYSGIWGGVAASDHKFYLQWAPGKKMTFSLQHLSRARVKKFERDSSLHLRNRQAVEIEGYWPDGNKAGEFFEARRIHLLKDEGVEMTILFKSGFTAAMKQKFIGEVGYDGCVGFNSVTYRSKGPLKDVFDRLDTQWDFRGARIGRIRTTHNELKDYLRGRVGKPAVQIIGKYSHRVEADEGTTHIMMAPTYECIEFIGLTKENQAGVESIVKTGTDLLVEGAVQGDLDGIYLQRSNVFRHLNGFDFVLKHSTKTDQRKFLDAYINDYDSLKAIRPTAFNLAGKTTTVRSSFDVDMLKNYVRVYPVSGISRANKARMRARQKIRGRVR